MARNKVEHVIEKVDSRGDARCTSPVEIQADVDIRFVGLAMNGCGSSHFGFIRTA
jgi:hypothetical protein